jgi:hypothetical protein
VKLNNAERRKAFRRDLVCLLNVFPRFIVNKMKQEEGPKITAFIREDEWSESGI